MKHLKLFFYLISFSLAFTACGGDDDDTGGGGNNGGKSGGDETSQYVRSASNTNANIGDGQNSLVKPYVNNLEFPSLKTTGNNVVVVHLDNTIGLNYTVEWDADKHAQRWSCYQLHGNNSMKNTDRYKSDTNQYPNDESLDSKYHFTDDPYRGSGFDHGHICPSNDRLASEKANYQTFFLTNMQPQLSGFNGSDKQGGVWLHMENQLFSRLSGASHWNTSNFREILYVCKGGTIDSEANLYEPRPYIGSGSNKIPVPKYFFMAILCKKPASQGGGYEAAAFWVEHKTNYDKNLLKYLISIDELEQKTGIDFFCNLPDKTEDVVEKTIGSSFKVGLQ